MSATLLDGNVLVALSVTDHVHHDRAVAWFGQHGGTFATTPITQGTLLRLLLREGASTSDAVQLLAGIVSHAAHEFWPDDLSYDATILRGVHGHRQVTDAYLVALVRVHGGRLATFDQALAALHTDVVDLIVP